MLKAKRGGVVPGDDLAYRRQVVLNDNGSVRWKYVLMGTWEPPTLHETDVRCVQGAWPYIVVSDEGSLRRWERQLGYGWYLADATRPKEPVQPFDVNERPGRAGARAGAAARHAALLASMAEEYKGIPYMVYGTSQAVDERGVFRRSGGGQASRKLGGRRDPGR